MTACNSNSVVSMYHFYMPALLFSKIAFFLTSNMHLGSYLRRWAYHPHRKTTGVMGYLPGGYRYFRLSGFRFSLVSKFKCSQRWYRFSYRKIWFDKRAWLFQEILLWPRPCSWTQARFQSHWCKASSPRLWRQQGYNAWCALVVLELIWLCIAPLVWLWVVLSRMVLTHIVLMPLITFSVKYDFHALFEE